MGLQSEDSTIAQLQTVLRFAHALRDAAGVSPPSSHSLSTSGLRAIVDSITLPDPPPLLPFLLDAGLSHDIAAGASTVYHLRSDELRRHFQESLVAACHKITELPVATLASSPDSFIRNVVSTFTAVYLRRLEQWKQEIVQRMKQASKAPTDDVTPKNSRTFNHEYVPLLEHFFDENPFPTHADKAFLAKKSNMEYRQIHVWFQNRRNRTKKEGKALKKKPIFEGATKPMDKLYERMKGHIVESEPQVPKTSKIGSSKGATQREIARKAMSKDSFTSSSPPHAFPSSYPPICHYDPFPCKSGPVHFSKPEWRRASCAKLPLPLSTNVDELVERFSQLSVRDERSKGSPKLQSHAATAAITVIPSRAPHPSLIVRKYRQPTNIIQRHPLVRAPVSSLNVFPSSCPGSKPVTLVPFSVPSNECELPGKRKIVSLPQRFFGRMRNACRDTIPSDNFPTSSASPRLFSLSSECYSSFFSSISSLSTSSSTQEIPNSFGSSCRLPCDSPIHLRNLGDMAAIIPSSVS